MVYKITIEDEEGKTITRKYNIEDYSVVYEDDIGKNVIGMIEALGNKEFKF